MSRTPLVAGNWKMHASKEMTARLVAGISAGAASMQGVDVLVCPPYPYLAQAVDLATGISIGSQDICDQVEQGAYTGEVNGAMLMDIGCSYSLVGHSERREYYGDTDAVVASKFLAAQAAGLVPVLCIGELLDEREAGNTESVLARQLDAVISAAGIAAFDKAVIAYEPVWAIGTGKTASPEQAQEVHAFIRARLADNDATIAARTRILYGGSVKPGNAGELFSCEDVDGGLIGGAALKAEDFLAICQAAANLQA